MSDVVRSSWRKPLYGAFAYRVSSLAHGGVEVSVQGLSVRVRRGQCTPDGLCGGLLPLVVWKKNFLVTKIVACRGVPALSLWLFLGIPRKPHSRRCPGTGLVSLSQSRLLVCFVVVVISPDCPCPPSPWPPGPVCCECWCKSSGLSLYLRLWYTARVCSAQTLIGTSSAPLFTQTGIFAVFMQNVFASSRQWLNACSCIVEEEGSTHVSTSSFASLR